MKQTGGHGQYAVCNIEIEPLPRGEGFVYEDKIFGGAIPQQFIPSIEKGIVKTMADGVLSGNPMVDVKVTLVDGKFHAVDSSDMAFQIAGSLALKEGVEKAGVALLEPIVQLAVVVPSPSPATSWATSTPSAARSRAWSRSAAASSGSTRWCPRARSPAT